MKFKINDKIQFIDLAEHIKPSKSYNVTILEAKVRNSGFTDQQRKELVQILAEALAPINKRLDKIEERLERIENTPTIKKELEELKKK